MQEAEEGGSNLVTQSTFVDGAWLYLDSFFIACSSILSLKIPAATKG